MADARPVAKVCVVCGEDCSSRPRTKDKLGRYYCNQCYARARSARSSLGTASMSAPGIPAIELDGAVDAKVMAELMPYAPDEASQPPAIHCPACGYQVSPDAIICIHCGLHLHEGEDDHAPKAEDPAKAWPRGLKQLSTTIYGTIALLLGAIGVLWTIMQTLMATSGGIERQAAPAIIGTSLFIGFVVHAGLLAAGTLMLLRRKHARIIAAATFGLAVAGYVFDFVLIAWPALAAFEATIEGDATFLARALFLGGALIIPAVGIFLFAILIRHLRRAQTRAELGDVRD